jgi:hypothetical protein
LIDPLSRGKVLEPVPTQVAKKIRIDEIPGRLQNEYLAAVHRRDDGRSSKSGAKALARVRTRRYRV